MSKENNTTIIYDGKERELSAAFRVYYRWVKAGWDLEKLTEEKHMLDSTLCYVRMCLDPDLSDVEAAEKVDSSLITTYQAVLNALAGEGYLGEKVEEADSDACSASGVSVTDEDEEQKEGKVVVLKNGQADLSEWRMIQQTQDGEPVGNR